MKSSETIKDNQVTLSILTAYLETCLHLNIQAINAYDDEIDRIFKAELRSLGCNPDKDKTQADLELGLAVEKHMKELRKAIASDQDAVDLLKRILPTGIL